MGASCSCAVVHAAGDAEAAGEAGHGSPTAAAAAFKDTQVYHTPTSPTSRRMRSEYRTTPPVVSSMTVTDEECKTVGDVQDQQLHWDVTEPEEPQHHCTSTQPDADVVEEISTLATAASRAVPLMLTSMSMSPRMSPSPRRASVHKDDDDDDTNMAAANPPPQIRLPITMSIPRRSAAALPSIRERSDANNSFFVGTTPHHAPAVSWTSDTFSATSPLPAGGSFDVIMPSSPPGPMSHIARSTAGTPGTRSAAGSEDTVLSPMGSVTMSVAQLTRQLAGSLPGLRMYDVLPDPVIVIDRESVIVFANTQCEPVLRHSANALIGQDVQVLIPSSYSIDHAALTRDFTVGQASQIVGGAGRLVEVLCGDGTKCPMRLTVQLTPDGLYFIGTLLDMSRYEAEIKATEKRFQQYLQHEFHNNLQAVHAVLDLLKDASNLPDVKARLPLALESSANILHMMVSMSRANSLDSSSFQLSPAMIPGNDVLRAIKRGAAGPMCHVDARQFDQNFLYTVDTSAVQQMVSHLVSNARRYCRHQFEVIISSRLQSDADRAALVISVIDDGPGISQADADPSVLFQKYGRLRRKSGVYHGGCGMGLYICRKLARLHDGDVQLVRSERSGCNFTIELHVNCNGRLLTYPGSPVLPAAGAPYVSQALLRILLVDDVATNTRLLASMLKKVCAPDCVIRAVNSGRECRDMVADFQPGLVLIDENMPDEQGSHVIPFIKHVAPNCVVVGVTGTEDHSVLRIIERAGADHILPKPVTKSHIINLLMGYTHLQCHVSAEMAPAHPRDVVPGLVLS